MSAAKKLFLIDAMALIYRAYFALQKNPRINTKNINTGPILGFTNTLIDILQNQNPTHIIVAFDTKEKTFRHTMYEAYKANRLVQPEDISIAIPYIQDILTAFHIPIMHQKGYEADDVIGTLAKQAAEQKIDTYIMSSDKDFAQLVNQYIYLYQPGFLGKKAIILDEKSIIEKWNIQKPTQVIDILGLQGDASDNIPGIPGVGPKTAQRLVQMFGSLENILENITTVPGKKLQDTLKIHAAQGLLSKQLATIHQAVPIRFCFKKSVYKGFDQQKLKSIFDFLEFRMLSQRLFGTKNTSSKSQTNFFDNDQHMPNEIFSEKKQTIENKKTQYHLVDTPEGYTQLCKKILSQKIICLDTETTGINPQKASLVGIAFAYQTGEAYYVPLMEDIAQTKIILQHFDAVFQSKKILKIGQNIKFDLSMLQQYSVNVQGPFFDTMIAHAFLHPESRHTLSLMSQQYLQYIPIPIENLIGEKKILNMREVPIDEVKVYACEDVDITLQLYILLKENLKKEGYEKIFYTIEMPLISVLKDMEYQGVCVDEKQLAILSKKFQIAIQNLTDEIYTSTTQKFNIDSPKQLGHVLFEDLKLSEKPIKTKTGQYATGEKILQQLAKKHPVVQNIIQYRALKKLKNTYVDTLPTLKSPLDGRIHTVYHQTHVITGRLSASNPNLQNIPIRTLEGKSIRQCFIPAKDYLLLSVDYSQIELRIMAAFSQDETMIKAFQKDQDIHQATAQQLFRINADTIQEDMRRKAKIANFGMLYGISAFGLSQQLNISKKEAKALIDHYFATFDKVKKYIETCIQQAQDKQYVVTLMGRKHWLRDINAKNAILKGVAERNAVNTPIQGTAAEIIKQAMIKIHTWLQKNNMRTKMIMQIHDELVFEVAKEELDIIKNQVKNLMENAVSLQNVPLKVAIGIGNHWLAAH